MATHTITLGVDGSGFSGRRSIDSVAAGVNLIDGEAVANGQTDFEINFDLDVSACKSFYLESTEDVVFETNSGGSPADSISLLANKPYIWHTNSYDSFLLGTDITTSVFITNASGSTATIYCVALYDVTP